MSGRASQITRVSTVCSSVCSGADQRKHQRPASLAFVRRIHRWPVDSRHKGPVTRKMFPFDDVATYSLLIRDVTVVCGQILDCGQIKSQNVLIALSISWALSLLLVQTQAARWKAATPEQLTGAHLYLDIAKSGYLFHAVGNVMHIHMSDMKCIWNKHKRE